MLEMFGQNISFEDLVFLLTASLVTTYVHVIYNPYTFADAIAEDRWGVIFGVYVLHLAILSLWILW